MTDFKIMTCIICPIGCRLELQLEKGKIKSISGNSCNKGAEYANSEFNNPERTLTTTIKVLLGNLPVVSVKTDKPIPKDRIFDCMRVVNCLLLNAPVHIGDIVAVNVLGTGANIIATKNVLACVQS